MPRGNPGVYRGPPWTEANTLRLRRMVSAGRTDREIALAIGVSLGAVIGKRQRMGIYRDVRLGGEGRGDPLASAIRRAERERLREQQRQIAE